MNGFQVYGRVVGLLGAEFWLTVRLVAAGVVIAVIHMAEPILLGRVVDALSKGNEAFSIIGLWALLGLFGIIASTVVAIAADRLAHRRQFAALASAFETAITLPLTYHAERGSGSIVRAIVAGTDALFSLWLSFLREQFPAIVGLILLVPTAFSIDRRMAGILAVLAIFYVSVSYLVVRKTSGGQSAVEHHHTMVYGRVGDAIGNATVIQSFGRLGAEVHSMHKMISDLLSAQYPVLTWWGMLTVLTKAAATTTMVLVFAAGAILTARGEMTVGEVVAFVAFANLMIGQLDHLTHFLTQVSQQVPTLRTLFELLDARPDIVEKPGAADLKHVKGHIKFENVAFRYGDDGPGISGIDLEVLPGQTVALVGPTGCGKTTTLALLQRMRDPQSGRIKIDDVDISNVTLSSLRHSIAVVFQDAGLFNRSIRENIQIGRPDATRADIEQASRLAEAHDFIEAKPGGYDCVIGERGALLSGGERQRLAIARAILKNAPILILDEATSALDAETEAKIKRGIDSLRRNRTTLIIAHRLSTVADADLILVMDKGRIVEHGRFDELAAGGGLFARLVAEGGFTKPTTDEVEAGS